MHLGSGQSHLQSQERRHVLLGISYLGRGSITSVAERTTTLHLHQNTEQEPSAFSRRRILPSAVTFCLRPNGSVSNTESFSEIGPISCFETASGGLIRLGSDCKSEKMLVLARPIMR